MGTITGQTLADNAAGLIHDVNRVRWTDTDWLQWLNDAQREAAVVKPDVNVVTATQALTAGETLQPLPSDALQLFDVTRNMGTDGATVGRAVRIVSRDALDSVSPTWHTDASTGEVVNYMYDPRAPKQFYVYPKAPATTLYVELVYSAIPTSLTALTEAISLDDIYANALVNYMLYRAYSRDDPYGENSQAATMYYQLFVSGLGAKLSAQMGTNPNRSTTAYSPESPASSAKPEG